MAQPQPNLQRRRSMSDFLRLQTHRDAQAGRNGIPGIILDGVLAHVRNNAAYRLKVKEFAEGLPKLTERDLVELDEVASPCPICLTPFSAILAEEETALALDSPAHPVEQLGVTRFKDTCGHIFCRKDTLSWVNQGRTTCPTCRRPFIDAPIPAEAVTDGGSTDVQLSDIPLASLNINFANLANLIMGVYDHASDNDIATFAAIAQGAQRRDEDRDRNEDEHLDRDDDDRDHFSGMYS
ncbi:uncharacterized protein B0H18DRAFT_973220 [Fomitopsis serialis]|uniref:uncharacterized protein n=1 Tax=Fomitopsis serialis TaxID=139415 RepID=UPI0020087C22|nr:uncharacterized protein B0H18DRAFT_973220 [Neoantrodia serialis]KAH9936298.1 hypothetical protein B0H18DRAFT_973220 [Neoantrodia serialis]